MLRILIADDETHARDFLCRLLAAHADVALVAVCGDGEDALAAMRRERPDAVFLDVKMPGLDGLAVLERFGEAPPAVVFTTAHPEYALHAFDHAAADYLLKPFDTVRLARALDRVRARLRGPAADAAQSAAPALAPPPLDLVPREPPPREPVRRLVVRDGERLHILAADDLRWVEADDKWLTLHAREGRYRLRRPIRELEAELDPARFARIHRATLLALCEVRELHPLPDGDYGVVLHDGTVLNLSRSYRDAFLARLRGAG